MNKAFVAVAFLLASIFSSALGQEKKHMEKKQVFIVPHEVYLPVIVAQPESPLKIERADLLIYPNGTYEKVYLVHNIGNKAIKSYRIAIWNSDNTGDVTGWHVEEKGELLMPGKMISVGGHLLEAVSPLSDDLRGKLNLKPTMKRIIFFMIVEIEFSDGSKYEAKTLFEALEKHLENFELIYEKKINP